MPHSAGTGYGFNTTSPNSWSWIARVLPYIEQGNLHTVGGLGNNPMPTIAASLQSPGVLTASTVVKTLTCPSDPESGRTYNNRAGTGSTVMGPTNYKGVAGSNWAWGSFTNVGPSGSNNGLDNGDGIFYRSDFNRTLTLTSITDGTSNTLMIGEDLPALNVHCGWAFFNHATGTASIPLNNAMRAGQPGYQNPTDWPNVYSFRSQHTGGGNFAMGDGSIRFVRDSITLANYRAAATRAGGETLNLD
jgi:prepilin-type processing-associated H-X9-DG protein